MLDGNTKIRINSQKMHIKKNVFAQLSRIHFLSHKKKKVHKLQWEHIHL